MTAIARGGVTYRWRCEIEMQVEGEQHKSRQRNG